MNILVVGSGAREHAIAWKISQSPLCDKLYVIPGNAGTFVFEQISFNLLGYRVKCEDFKLPPLGVPVERWHGFFKIIESVVRAKGIDLIIVQAEEPISHGIEDWFSVRGFKIFAASSTASILEWSKIFPQGYLGKIKDGKYSMLGQLDEATEKKTGKKSEVSFFLDNTIPHAEGFGFRTLPEGLAELPSKFAVVKASGLRGGKGVTVVASSEELVETATQILSDPEFVRGERGVVVQELLDGWEVSCHAFTDGTTITMMPFAFDVKRIGEGDSGENTGGVASVSGPGIVLEALEEQIRTKIVEKTILGMKKIGRKLIGVVYPGLFITKEGPKVIEYNIRFGDPETQVILSKLKTDLLEIILTCLDGKLDEIKIEWDSEYAVCLVLCSGGYPDASKMKVGVPIFGLDKIPEDILVFHAGTTFNENGEVITTSGRVLSIVGKGSTLEEAFQKTYSAAKLIKFEGIYYRRDIEETIAKRRK